MKGVQCYELFGGIALYNYAFLVLVSSITMAIADIVSSAYQLIASAEIYWHALY